MKPDEVRDRDRGEIVSMVSGASHNILTPNELLEPQTSTVDEMMRSLSDEQKEMMIFSIQDSFELLAHNRTGENNAQ